MNDQKFPFSLRRSFAIIMVGFVTPTTANSAVPAARAQASPEVTPVSLVDLGSGGSAVTEAFNNLYAQVRELNCERSCLRLNYDAVQRELVSGQFFFLFYCFQKPLLKILVL